MNRRRFLRSVLGSPFAVAAALSLDPSPNARATSMIASNGATTVPLLEPGDRFISWSVTTALDWPDSRFRDNIDLAGMAVDEVTVSADGTRLFLGSSGAHNLGPSDDGVTFDIPPVVVDLSQVKRRSHHDPAI